MIRSAGFDPGTETLEIEFTDGSVYQYTGISPAVYNDLMTADSAGHYFHAVIKKGAATCTRVA